MSVLEVRGQGVVLSGNHSIYPVLKFSGLLEKVKALIFVPRQMSMSFTCSTLAAPLPRSHFPP